MVLFGIAQARVLVFNVHVPSRMVIKALDWPIQGPLSLKRYMQCHPELNCLGIVSRCSAEGDTCVLVVPPIQTIVVADGSVFSKYFDAALDVKSPLETALFADEKKLVLVHGLSLSEGTVRVSVFRFGKARLRHTLLQQSVLVARPLRHTSVADVALGDRSRVGVPSSVFGAFVFRRFLVVHVCFVHVRPKVMCFALKEPGTALPLSLGAAESAVGHSVKTYFAKALALVAALNAGLLGVLWWRAGKADFRAHTSRSVRTK